MIYLYAVSECYAALPAALLALVPLAYIGTIDRTTIVRILLGLALLLGVEGLACAYLDIPANWIVIPTFAALFIPYWRLSALSLNRAAFVYAVSASQAMFVNSVAVTVDAAVVGNSISSTHLAWPGMVTQWALLIVLSAILLSPHARTVPRVLASNAINTIAWRLFWLVPVISCMFLWYITPSVGDTELLSFDLPSTVLTACAIYVLDYIVYWLASLLSTRSCELVILSQLNHFLSIQAIQRSQFETRIKETRRIRHDMRQHNQTVLGLLEANNLEAAKEYLANATAKSAQQDTPLVHCNDPAVNALVTHYTDQASDLGARVELSVRSFECSGVDPHDLTVLLGNLLENAVDALREQCSGPRVLSVNITGGASRPIFITVDNTFDHDIKRKADRFVSTKPQGNGLGIESVQTIAETYRGIAKFEYSDTLFQASVMLNPRTQ